LYTYRSIPLRRSRVANKIDTATFVNEEQPDQYQATYGSEQVLHSAFVYKAMSVDNVHWTWQDSKSVDYKIKKVKRLQTDLKIAMTSTFGFCCTTQDENIN
jgi:hypothetical protein